MAAPPGEDTPAAEDDNPCPLCGSTFPAPAARVSLAKRRLFPTDSPSSVTARADSTSEASALRESLAAQRRAAALLHADLEAERSAAADAASEAMSMILRLQRDKSEAMMDARQYRRFAEDRFAHDAAEAEALRGAVARRDEVIRVLRGRVRECQDRLLRLGFPSPGPVSGSMPSSPVPPAAACEEDECTSVRQCGVEYQYLPPTADVGTPRTHHLLNRMPGQDDDDTDNHPTCGGSPRHARALSLDGLSCLSSSSFDGLADDEYHHLYDRRAPDQDEDDYEAVDRVYTVDAVHGVPWADEQEEAAEIQKLKARLQALEADRECMRHAIMSMGDEKAQVVMLEIAQQICREGAVFPAAAGPVKVQPRLQPVVVAQRKVVKRQPNFVEVFIVTVIKWIASIFCWRKKSDRIKYPIGLCGSNVGLMLLLDRYPKQKRRKFLKKEPKF